MKVHTTAFKEQIKEMGRELDSIITFGDTVLGNEQLNAVTPSFQGGILKSVMKQLDIDSNVPIPVGTILNYKFGVKVNGEYEYLNFGNYVVKDIEKQEDTMSYKITCYDKLLFSMKDYSKMPITYPITIRSYISALCSFLGIRFANDNDTFVNYNKTIPNELYLDTNGNSLGYTFRDVFDELAQVTASTICLNENDEVEIRYINDTGDIVDEQFLKNVNVNFGEKYGPINTIVLSRSGGSDKVYKSFPENLPDVQKNSIEIANNQIMNFNDRSDYLPEILRQLNGLEYYLNDFSSTGITYYDICDRYGVQVGDTIYSCVMFNDEILVTQGLEENVFTEIPEQTETDYTKADKTDRRINQTYLIVDKQNQKIESVITQTDIQNEKIAKVTQTVEELNSKISDIADITTSGEDNDAQVELSNINKSEPIRLVVRPIEENISYLYPSDNLYPSDDLFLKIRTIRFHNKKTNEDFDYELPDDLLYYDSENFDEFILDYDGQSCVINKKVGYNADGTTYVLDEPKTVEYPYPKIVLSEGDYDVYILSYSQGYIFARLMAQNIYTTQFYTKAEVDSEFVQQANTITAEVNQKLKNYSTTSETNAKIEEKITESEASITSSISKKYATKEETKQLDNKIEQRITDEVNEINLEVSKKVNDKDYTGANIILKINGDTSGAQIDADVIKLNANDILNLLAGNAINLTSKNIVITSNNFSVDASGNVIANNLTSNNAKITGGKITLNSSVEEPGIIMNKGSERELYIYDTAVDMYDRRTSQNCNAIYSASGFNIASDLGIIQAYTWEELAPRLIVRNTNPYTSTYIYGDKVESPAFNNNSLQETKKNFQLLENGIEIIKNADLYKYHLKTQQDDEKKHIGLVIGDEYKTPKEVLNNENTGVDLYSMTSVAWQAIKEQQEQIELLKQEIELLKNKESDK